MAKSPHLTPATSKTPTSEKRLEQLRKATRAFRLRQKLAIKQTTIDKNSVIISDFKAHVMAEVKRLATRTFKNGYRAGQQYLMQVRDQEHDEVALEDHRSALTQLARTMQRPTMTRATKHGWHLKG